MGIVETLRYSVLGGLMGTMLVFPRQAAESALGALWAFGRGVLPGLLPFSALSLLLTAGRTLPAGLLTLLALPGGSPAGARLFRDAGLSPRESRGIAARTGVMSPMFFLSTLSLWLGDSRKGALLLAVHFASALLAGCLYPARPAGRIKLPPLTLAQAAAQSGQAMLTAAACAALGAVCARMAACALPGLPPLPLAILQGALEITSGCKALSGLGAPLPLLAALTGFTGFSILLQNAAFWQENGLTLADLARSALLRAALSAALCALAMFIG